MARFRVPALLLWLILAAGPALPEADRANQLYESGIEMMRQGRWQKAIVKLEEAAREAPQRARIHEALAGAYFNAAIDLGFESALAAEPAEGEESWQVRVEKLCDAAEKSLKRAIELEPRNAAYHHALGWLYLGRHWQHLFDAAEEGAQEKPASEGEADSAKSDAPSEKKETPAPARRDFAGLALKEFETAAKLAPAIADYRRSLGDALRIVWELEEEAAAVRKLEEASKKKETQDAEKPETLESPETKAAPAEETEPAGMDRALEQYRAALRLSPNDASLQYLIYTEIAATMGEDSPEALEHLRRARQADPQNALFGYEIARRLFLSGRPGEALNALRYANLAPQLTLVYVPAYPRRLAYGLRRIQLGVRAFPVFARLRELARFGIQAASAMAAFDVRGALGADREVVRLGERLEAQGDPIARLVGMEIQMDALEHLAALADFVGNQPEAERAHMARMLLAERLQALREQGGLGFEEIPEGSPAERP